MKTVFVYSLPRLRTSGVHKPNNSNRNKARSRRYLAERMTDEDHADIQALLENTPAQEKSLLHSLEQAAVDNDMYMNANKTEYMHFKQKGSISTISGKPQKLEDQFTYLGSNILSIESDVNTHLVKA